VKVVLAWGIGLAALAAGEPRVDFARGVLEEARGGDGGAWFERACEADPDAFPLLRRVAGRRLAAGDIEGASTLWREFAAAHPQRLEAQLGYADFLRQASPRDDFAAKLAGETLERALARHPGHPEIERRLFRSYEQRGMRERSLALFERIAAREGSVLLAAEMARTLFDADDAGVRARLDAWFRRDLEARPADPVLARAASEHFRTTGRLPEAIEMLAIHVDAAPASLDLRVRLGILHFAAREYGTGVAVLRQVLEADPRQALAHQALAKHFREQGDAEAARPHAVALLEIRGGEASEFVELGDELLAAEEPRRARLLLEKGLFDHPESASIARRLAIATRRDPESRERAPRRFREAAALGAAEDPEFLREFAECLVAAGEVGAAEERLREAIRRYPPGAAVETAAALRRLASIWESEGRHAAAARSLRARAEGLDPVDSPAE